MSSVKMQMDKKMRIKRLRDLHRDIKEKEYPPRMETDRVLVLRELEDRIFQLAGGIHEIKFGSEVLFIL